MNPVEALPPSDAEVAMARFVAGQLSPDGRGEFEEFLDRTGEHSLDMLTCPDAPSPGFTSVSTMTLHRSPNLVGPMANPVDARVEFVTVLEGVAAELVTGLLVASAFTMVKEGVAMIPGTLFPGIIEGLVDNCPEHLLFTAPGNFPRLSRYPLAPGVDVHWLQAVPIHEVEREFLLERGLGALEDRFAAAEVPFSDLTRPPAL
ncbi:MAG: suppressor of fused domain protein [Janthinobacterium lividum]